MYILSTCRTQRSSFLGFGCCIANNNLLARLSVESSSYKDNSSNRESWSTYPLVFLGGYLAEHDEERLEPKLSVVG